MTAIKKTILGAFVLLAFASLLSFSSALDGTVLISAESQQASWLADGNTVYRLDVAVDNMGLPSQSTQALEWRLNFPSFVTVVDYTDYDPLYPQDDFFEGVQTFNVVQPNSNSIYIGRAGWSGVSSNVGNVATYWFTVSPAAPRGEFDFVISDSEILDSNEQVQSHIVQNAHINIVSPPRCRALSCRLNAILGDDGRFPVGSLTTFLLR